MIGLLAYSFRGIDAAASLKRRSQRPAVGHPDAFRGIDAAASLKRLDPVWNVEHNQLSAASMPRPH